MAAKRVRACVANARAKLIKTEILPDIKLEPDLIQAKQELDMAEVGVKLEVDETPKPRVRKVAKKLKPFPVNGVKNEVKNEIDDIENCEPVNWRTYFTRIREMRAIRPSPVDTVGCCAIGGRERDRLDAKTVRFQHLISLMLSAQTKDEVTSGAVDRLRAHLKPTLTPQSLIDSSDAEIENLILPVGFFRRKAMFIRQAALICRDQYGGDIPSTIEEIMALPGVGPKMGHLLLQNAWGQVDGIGVDVHVHRLAHMWNWVPQVEHPTPEKTRLALEKWLPRELWKEINPLLVGFGQTWCPSRGSPKHCAECLLNDICPSAKN